MPNLKSAKKRVRQNVKRRDENMEVRSRMRTMRRKFLEAIEGGDVEASTLAYSGFCSAIDKAAKKNVVNKNNAIRSKTRAANRLRTLSAK